MAFASRRLSPRPRTTAPAATVVMVIVASWTATAPAAPGDLDPAFSTDGKQMTRGGAYASTAIAIQDDGGMVITGPIDYFDSPPPGFVLERVRADGTIDGSFGTDGRVTTELDGGGMAAAIALQADGKIVVAGESQTGNIALARYLPDGSLDDTFSDDGLVTTNLAGHVSDVLVQPDGRIVTGGWGYPAGSTGADFQLSRFDADGSPDDSFSGDGEASFDLGCDDVPRGLALGPDGDIVLAGSTCNRVAVARLRPDGALDPSFSDDGVLTADPSGDTDRAADVVVEPDGKIVTAGYGLPLSPGSDLDRRFEFELLRLQPDGEFDPTFSGGVVTTRIGPEARAHGLVRQPDGKLVAVGESAGDFALARYNPDGTLDESFSYNGKLATSFSYPPSVFAEAVADDVALDPDGKIVVGGYLRWVSVPDYSEAELWALARYEVSSGPHDADADAVRDRLDKCVAIFGEDVGCPHMERSLSIRYSNKYDEFRGRLSGGGFKCEAHQRVAVYKQRPGPDRRIGRHETGYDGEWEVSRFRPHGRFYARVKRRINPRWGVCAATRSKGVAF